MKKLKKKKEWSPDAYIKSHLRKIWRWSPQRRLCLKAKQCCKCRSRGKLFADHISPVVGTREGFTDWNTYIFRLFTGELQPLCETCHKEKSKTEAKERVIARKARKAIELPLD